MSKAGDSRTDRSQQLHTIPPAPHATGGKIPRRQFITDHLGLSHDPFLFEAAENEVQEYPDDFLAYFVVPDPELWRRLLGVEPLVIFGAHGSGKTTLRLNAAYQLRRTPAPTLVVTCDFSGSAPADMRTFLAQQIAKDTLIQTLERLDTVIADEARDAQTVALLSSTLYGSLRSTLARVADSSPGERIDRMLAGRGRESSEYMEMSPAFRDFLQKLLLAPAAPGTAGELETCIAVAHGLGFASIQVLADGFDAGSRQGSDMAALLAALVEATGAYREAMILKTFLPTSTRGRCGRA